MYQEEDDYGQLPYGQDSMSQPKASTLTAAKDNRRRVEEKIPKENFRVNREMRNEISVYESILSIFWAKIASKCRENCVKI